MIMEFRKSHPEIKILPMSGGGGITGRFGYLPITKLVGFEETLKKPFQLASSERVSIQFLIMISKIENV